MAKTISLSRAKGRAEFQVCSRGKVPPNYRNVHLKLCLCLEFLLELTFLPCMKLVSNPGFFSIVRPLTSIYSCGSAHPLSIKTALLSAGPALCKEPSCSLTLFIQQSYWNGCLFLLKLLFGRACVSLSSTGTQLCRRGSADPGPWAGWLFILAWDDLKPASAPWGSPDSGLLGPLFCQLDLSCPGSFMMPGTEDSRASGVDQCSFHPPCKHTPIWETAKSPWAQSGGTPRDWKQSYLKQGDLFKGMDGGWLSRWTSKDSFNFSARCSVRDGFAGSLG